ncbi:glutamate racemase [bacterium]|nr:glutamate racemase [bacterium]
MSILNNIKNSPIGFFDSGVGGLTVLSKVKKLMPNESFIFYGDTAHVPYGEKTKEQLLEYSKPILKFFEQKKCKAVVMACNTTSSIIYNDIKGKYNFKIYPVVQSVAKMLANLDVERLGVFATKATIQSGAYEREISKYNKNIEIFGQFCPDWVKIVEENLIEDSKDSILKDLEKMLENKPQKIVLGCTHYPYLLNVLTEIIPRGMFIDPADYLANIINNDLVHSDENSTFEEFYVSANPEQFKTSAKMFYQLENIPQLKSFS